MGNSFHLKNYNEEDLTIKIFDDSEHNITVKFTGELTNRLDEDDISEYFKLIHEKVIENNLELIKLDCTEMGYLDSRGIGTFITWLYNINNMNEDEQYKIILIYNKDLSIHKTSFDLIKNLFPLLLELKSS